MNKKILYAISVILPAMALATAFIALRNVNPISQYAVNEYEMKLNSSTQPVSKDDGYYHEVVVKDNMFDAIGYANDGSGFGSIKKANYGSYTYNGMIFNRSIINGLAKLSVKFSGGSLNYVFSEYLMENMDFNGEALTSEVAVDAPAGSGYFIVYTESTSPVHIEELKVSYLCDGSLDNSMIYNESTINKYARSTPSETIFYNDSFEFTNRPQSDISNYSTNTYNNHPGSWYRWNGRCSQPSEYLGNDFAIDTTIMGNISQAIDPNSFFHYSMWVNYEWGTGANDNDWEYVYIGNDNYEPLGSENRIMPQSDHYADYSYAGRFFTMYSYDEDAKDWVFVNPDTHKINDNSLTLRQAYERYTLPYWHLSYRFSNGMFSCFINGMKIFEEELADGYNGQSIRIKAIHFHSVNYGAGMNQAGTAYKAFYTYPRVTYNPVDYSTNYVRGTAAGGWEVNEAYRLGHSTDVNNRGEILNVYLDEGDFKIANEGYSNEWGWSHLNDSSEAYANFSPTGEYNNIHCDVAGSYNIYLTLNDYIYITFVPVFSIDKTDETIQVGESVTVTASNYVGNLDVFGGDDEYISYTINGGEITFTGLQASDEEFHYFIFDENASLDFYLTVNPVAETWTIYFQSKSYFNSGSSDEHVYIYAWESGTDPIECNAEFPGEEMTWVEDQAGSKKIFKFELDVKYTYVIFSKLIGDAYQGQTEDVELSSRGDNNCIWVEDRSGMSADVATGWMTYTPA